MGNSKNQANKSQAAADKAPESQMADSPYESEGIPERAITELELKIIDEAVLITKGKKATDFDLMQITKRYIEHKEAQ